MAFMAFKKNDEKSAGVEQCEWQLKQIEQDRIDCYTDIGRLYVRKNTAEEAAGTPYEEMLIKLEKLEERRELLEKRKLALQDLRKCEKCGAILGIDSMFCNKCGQKLGEIAPEVLTDAPLCPSCKMPVEEGSTFCIHCGAIVSAETAAGAKPVTGNVCPSCGALCDDSNAFCIKCGIKLH